MDGLCVFWHMQMRNVTKMCVLKLNLIVWENNLSVHPLNPPHDPLSTLHAATPDPSRIGSDGECTTRTLPLSTTCGDA